MNQRHSKSASIFGFFSVIEFSDIGYCGGLLVVSGIGRPIEFHCCSPVKANRAQSILYGKTFDSFLFGEQIGLSLIDKTKVEPEIFVTNRPELLVLNEHTNIPAVYIQKIDEKDGSENADTRLKQTIQFRQDEFEVFSNRRDESLVQNLRSVLSSFTSSLSLDEPFERIQKAIEEAQAVAA